MNCIVVDENKNARKIMRSLIAQIPFLDLKKECINVREAISILENEDIDLVFLNVETHGLKATGLVRNLKKRPILILITSKENYAVEADGLSVADYIIKPLTPERFAIAVAKAKELFETKKENTQLKDKDYIFVRSDSIVTKIKLNDIIYMQALGNYVNIFSDNKRSTVHGTLKSLEDKLPTNKFYRLNGSYLVGIDHVDHVEENAAYLGKHTLPISGQYGKELLSKLKSA